MDAKIESEVQDVATEMDNKINQFIIDNNLPNSLRPYIYVAAWIGAGVISRSFVEKMDKYEKDNQILDEVFKAIK
jgi:hypothetical protein